MPPKCVEMVLGSVAPPTGSVWDGPQCELFRSFSHVDTVMQCDVVRADAR